VHHVRFGKETGHDPLVQHVAVRRAPGYCG
jgi:hypothetical protein